MRRLPHSLRALLAATAAAAATFAVSAPLTAAAQDQMSAATAASTPTPTPCPTGVSGLLCTIGGGPTVPPTPTATPTPSPTPSGAHGGSPSSRPSSSSGAAAAKPSSTPSPGAAPTATPTVTLNAIAARFANAPFLESLLDILAHPAAADQPDLLHFRIPADPAQPAVAWSDHVGLPLTSAADPTPPPSPAPAPDHRGWSVLAALLAGLVAAALVSARTPGGRVVLEHIEARLWRKARYPGTHLARLLMRTARGRRLQAAIALAACPVVIAAAVAGAVGPQRPASVPTPPVAAVDAGTGNPDIAGSEVAPAAGQVSSGSIDGMPVWSQLVAIEQGIADQQDALTGQESDLSRLARMAAAASGDDMVAPPPAAVAQAGVLQRIATLVSAHEQTQGQLDSSLQAEYTLYRGAAQDPGQKQQLLKGAAQAPAPEAKQAVADDLARIETQLSQEQVISDARAKLARIGSLTQKQLDAIQSHQAFIAPELAPISQPFGPTDFSMEPPLTFGGVFHPHFHTGIDLAGALGTPVHAAADGVVIVATASTDGQGHLVGYGNYVVIAHPDGFITLYGHLDSLAVKTGQVVRQGEIVGQEGSTGWSTGPHLHFEIRLGDALLDPAQYLKGQLG